MPGDRKLIGVLGSGWIGRDPFDRRSWSTLSYHFFTALKNQGMLHRAFGVEASRLRRWFLLAKNVHFQREVWQHHFYLDLAYRDALTRAIGERIEPGDFDHEFLQLGALYDVPGLLAGRTRCFSYHDGNLAESARSPYFPRGISARVVDRALDYEKKVAHGMAVVFTMSDYLRQSFIRDYEMPPSRVVSIGAGVNLDELPERVPSKAYDTKEILFIGVDFARKGGWELLRAFRGVCGKHPTAKLHVVGPRELAIPADLQAGVEYHGYVSRSTPEGRAKSDELFRRASLFVMPSLYEPFGVAPLEALVHQLPCVLTRRWALQEMVTPGENGELVECGNVEDIEVKLSTLLSEPEQLQRMGEAGRQRVLSYYTWPKVAGRLIQAVRGGAAGAVVR
jgi:glycosyltransferase involved in cell wall biosynthesis